MYRQADYPRYLPGLWTTVALQVLTMILLVLLSINFKRLNKRVDEGTYVAEDTKGFKYTL